jgi:glyoxylase I family protein
MAETKGETMPGPVTCGAIHHMRLTVTNVERSREFYTKVLGFEVAVGEEPPGDHPDHDVLSDSLQGGVILMNQGMFIGLRPVDESHGGDRFDPHRVGLDHVSFSAETRADLEKASVALDELGVPHGPVRDLPPFGMCFLAFFDPDGIALELSAPM